MNKITTEVLRIWPKYLLCNIIRGLGLTVTNWFSPSLCQWSNIPMFKRDNKYFQWISPQSISHGLWKWSTIKTFNHSDTENLQKLLTIDKVRDTSLIEIWIIHFHSYIASATFTMNYRAHHSKTPLKNHWRQTHSPSQPGLHHFSKQRERLMVVGSAVGNMSVYIVIHFRSHNGVCRQGLLMMPRAFCTHLESRPP